MEEPFNVVYKTLSKSTTCMLVAFLLTINGFRDILQSFDKVFSS